MRIDLKDPETARKTLYLYHAECTDGFLSASIVCAAHKRSCIQEFEYSKTDLNALLSKDGVEHVVMLDCSLNLAAVWNLLQKHRQLRSWTVLDHHRSAMEQWQAEIAQARHLLKADLSSVWAGEDENSPLSDQPHWSAHIEAAGDRKIATYIAKDLCGAQMAHRFYAHGEEPWWVSYAADRDLWKHALESSKEINAGLWALTAAHTPASFVSLLGDPALKARAYAVGSASRPTIDALAAEVARKASSSKLGGHSALVVACPRALRSEVGEKLAQRAAIGVTWEADAEGRVTVSLRSCAPDGVDVDKVAQAFGGGGHKHAAGFVVRDIRTTIQILYS
jgi:hypothetical protein